MKKDLIFAPALLVVGVLLFLLGFTGIIAHIVISVVGVALLAAYTALTVKSWKIPALEIAMRASYGIALISGIVVKASEIVAVAIIHKITAALFVAILAGLLIYKIIAVKKAK